MQRLAALVIEIVAPAGMSDGALADKQQNTNQTGMATVTPHNKFHMTGDNLDEPAAHLVAPRRDARG
jgi:hypothetical protein